MNFHHCQPFGASTVCCYAHSSTPLVLWPTFQFDSQMPGPGFGASLRNQTRTVTRISAQTPQSPFHFMFVRFAFWPSSFHFGSCKEKRFLSKPLQNMPSSHPLLDTLTLRDIANGLDNGTLTVTQLAESHLARIEAINPSLRAVLQVNPNALTSAVALDEELQRSGRRG